MTRELSKQLPMQQKFTLCRRVQYPMNDKVAGSCGMFCVVYSKEVGQVASDAFLFLCLTYVSKNALFNSQEIELGKRVRNNQVNYGKIRVINIPYYHRVVFSCMDEDKLTRYFQKNHQGTRNNKILLVKRREKREREQIFLLHLHIYFIAQYFTGQEAFFLRIKKKSIA